MPINIKHKKDLITVDIRTKQIRYCENFKQRGFIHFLDLSRTDANCYKFLFNDDEAVFLDTLKSDLKEFINKDISLNACEVMKC